ncbi:venom allergen 5.01-like isoform X2 [Lycorma delicatula]|uniref:venom allergen 5.01-like isoform X2 n=1 Tax=Lycorma delicatula TaxID=130591 RepID=UPI003F510FE9
MYKVLFLIFTFLAVSFCCEDGQLIRKGMRNEDAAAVVKYHNLARSCIAQGRGSTACRKLNASNQMQPQAANLRAMSWDNKLAARAQAWADNCEFRHDSRNSRHDSRFSVGQNLAITSSTYDDGGQPDFKHAIKLWFGEHKLYHFSPIGMSNSHGTGHYTQMIWADTFRVGCGFSYYTKGDGWFHKLYVCNYGPSGNFMGQLPYERGQPSCSRFSNYYDTKGLCA